MHTAVSVVTTGFLVTAVAAPGHSQPSLEWLQGPPPPRQPDGETNRIITQSLEDVGERYRGAPAYYNGGIYGDIIGTFFGLLATGSYAQAYKLRDGVCAAWRAMPPDGPFTGHAFIGGMEVNLDKTARTNRAFL
jgi:hypothetical protein